MSSTITVRGEATVGATPDWASLRLGLSAVLPSADEALDDVGGRSQALASLLDAAGIRDVDRVTSSVVVPEEREYADGSYHHRGYRASTSVDVTIRDPKVIGTIMSQSVSRAAASVGGPWWYIADDNPAHTDVRILACEDARRRAAAYARGLGVRVGAVVAVAEPGVLAAQQTRGAMFAERMAVSETREVEVEEGDLDLSAKVEVVFAVEQ